VAVGVVLRVAELGVERWATGASQHGTCVGFVDVDVGTAERQLAVATVEQWTGFGRILGCASAEVTGVGSGRRW